VFARRSRILVAVLALALGLAACGHKEAHPSLADANNDGGYVDAGPVTYQLQVSRVLNPYSTEDSQYVQGLPPGTPPLTANQEWYGVFMWAKNQTDKPQVTTNNFVIVDTQGNKYYPLKLNPLENSYAWRPQVLLPLQIQPKPDTTAYFGPTQGGLLLFRINDSAYSNRPLTLYILGSENQRLASISLDL
jgi:hypothetical protein